MTDLLDFVALSLLPLWYGAARGRAAAGAATRLDASSTALADALAARDEPGKASELRSRGRGRDRARGGCRHHARSPWSDPAYPAALAAIADPPPVLWMRGDRGGARARPRSRSSDRARRRRTRSPSPTRSPRDLAARGLVVVSGLARGVDSAAHRGALSAAARRSRCSAPASTSIYPREHAALAREIEQDGRGRQRARARARRRCRMFFPRRNRIISGLSRAVVVIEAGEKSGSLITARCALEQGRDVLAVPGNVLSGRNRGGHALLRDGARIVESADDILEELGMATAGRSPPAQRDVRRAANHDPVLACLTPGEAVRSRRDCRAIGPQTAASAAAAVRARAAGSGAARRRRPVRPV